MKPTLTEQDFQDAAADNGLAVAAIKAVAQVEAPRGGFDDQDVPVTLFEGQWFSHFTNGAFDKSHPTISYPNWTRQFYGNHDVEKQRLAEACALDQEAALKSASWGKFQIMGFNHEEAGFATLQDFVNAMYASEHEHLKAFINFLKNDRHGQGMVFLRAAAKNGDWVSFALFYNGSGEAKNQYDKKLAAAFREHE